MEAVSSFRERESCMKSSILAGALASVLAVSLSANTFAATSSDTNKSEQSKADQSKLPKVVILATGGTIAGAQPEPGSYGYKSGEFSINDLIKAVPGMDKLAKIEGEQVANIGSQDMN